MAAQRRLLDRWQRGRASAEHSARVKRQYSARPSSRGGAVHWRSLLPGARCRGRALAALRPTRPWWCWAAGRGQEHAVGGGVSGQPVLRGLRGLDRLPHRPVLDALRPAHRPVGARAGRPFSRLRPYRLDLAPDARAGA